MTGIPVRDFLERQGLPIDRPLTKSDFSKKYGSPYPKDIRNLEDKDDKIRGLIYQYFGNIDHLEKYTSEPGSEDGRLGHIGVGILEQIAMLDGKAGLDTTDFAYLETLAEQGSQEISSVDLRHFIPKYRLNNTNVTADALDQARAQLEKDMKGQQSFLERFENVRDYWFLGKLAERARANESQSIPLSEIDELAQGKPKLFGNGPRKWNFLEVRDLEDDDVTKPTPHVKRRKNKATQGELNPKLERQKN